VVQVSHINAAFPEKISGENMKFIFGHVLIRPDAPVMDMGFSLKNAENRVGVAHINGEKHGLYLH
jgi:hypothetical protein